VLLSNRNISKEERLMKVRKIVAGLAAVSMLAAFSAQAVFAADSVSIKAGEAKAAAGEKFTLEVSLADVPTAGVNEIEFAVTYDSKAITISGVTAGKAAQTGVNDAEKLEGVNGFEAGWDTAGTITVSYSTGLTDAKYALGDGVFAVISGTVAAGTADGDYPVKITAIARETVQGKGDTNKEIKAGLLNADGTVTKYTVTGVDGKVVVGNPTPTEKETEKPTEAEKPTEKETEKETSANQETKPVGEVTYCDVNCDGQINVMDIIRFNKFSVGAVTLDEQAQANADVDANGEINSTDGLNILKRVVDILKDSDFPIKK
jgi:hypothetical protein